MTRKDLQRLAIIRLREARLLLRAGFNDGAFYLAGYSVECGLKACIAKGTQRHEFPDKKKVDSSYTHDLRQLAQVAQLKKKLLEQAKQSPEFRNNWDVVASWSEQSRYRTYPPERVQALVEAVGNRDHGVISWIKRHW